MGSIDSFQFQQMKERVARGAQARSSAAPLESLPSEKLAQGLDETAPYRVNGVVEGEIKNLHEPFEKWLRLNADCLLYIHSRPDMPTTNQKGCPDFVVIGRGGHAAFVEFKAHKEPDKHLTKDQEQWAATSMLFGIPYLCTNDLQAACQFVKKQLLEKI